MKIDLTKIKNLIVRKSLEDRSSGFIFSYGDADEQIHTDGRRGSHSESRGFQDGRYPTNYEDEHNNDFDLHPDSY